MDETDGSGALADLGRVRPPPCPLCAGEATGPFEEAACRTYLRCGACKLVFLRPDQRPDPEQELAHYALHQNDPADPRYRRFLAQLLEPLAARLAPGAEGLDYGCGPGPAVSVMLGEAGWRVRDYDPLFRPDETALLRTYDFITCTEAAEHFHDPRRDFQRLDALLRGGGRLGVMTSLLTEEIDFRRWSYVRDVTHVAFYSAETLDWIAAWRRWSLETDGRRIAIFSKNG